MSLTKELNKIDERNGVTEKHQLASEDLAKYIDTQIDEMRHIIMRDRVDVLLNQEITVEGKQEREGRDAKVRELDGRITQMVEAVDVLTKLRDEL